MIKYVDMNETILKIRDVVELKGKRWKLENISGVSLAVRRDGGKVLETKVLMKFDFEKAELCK